jgi:hypothetical protein
VSLPGMVETPRLQGEGSLVILLIDALPTWGHSKSWGPYPSGGIGLILLILVILLLLGRI